MVVEKRVHWPPPISTPKEAPWREVEEIIETLKAVATKLDILITLISGVQPGPPVVVTVAPLPHKNTFITGQKNVSTAGTPEQLDAIPIPDGFPVTIIAKTDNTGYIYLGKSKSECAMSQRRFDGLSAGLAHSLKIKNLSEVWVDASADGDGVSWSVESD